MKDINTLEPDREKPKPRQPLFKTAWMATFKNEMQWELAKNWGVKNHLGSQAKGVKIIQCFPWMHKIIKLMTLTLFFSFCCASCCCKSETSIWQDSSWACKPFTAFVWDSRLLDRSEISLFFSNNLRNDKIVV